MWILLSEISENVVCLILALTFDKSDCSRLFAGRPNRHSTTNVQSSCWAGSPRVLYQSPTGCSGVFIALHKHGGGKVTISFCFSLWSSAFHLYYYFFSPTEELSLWVQPIWSLQVPGGGEDCVSAIAESQVHTAGGLHCPVACANGPGYQHRWRADGIQCDSSTSFSTHGQQYKLCSLWGAEQCKGHSVV